VCDDGSDDGSKKIIEDIDDVRVIWVSGNHSGTPAIPRNRGMSMSKGEWIAFCDSDDEWLPAKLEEQIDMITKSKCMASCTSSLIKKNGTVTDQKVSSWNKKTISFKKLLRINDIVCSSTMIHSSIFNKIGGFPEELEYRSFEDYIYWLRISTKTDFAFVSKPLVIYDDHPETSLRSLFKDGYLLRLKTLNNFIDWAIQRKLYWFVIQAKKQVLKDRLKKILRDKIRS
jgi:glycosyltransferase involved in cell wall biosynthesis